MNQPLFLSKGWIRCPCVNFVSIGLKTPSKVRHYLYIYGFLPNYYTRIVHGEENQNVDLDGHSSSGGNGCGDILDDEEQFDAMNEMVYNAIRPFFFIPNGNSNMENETLSEVKVPNEKAQQSYDELISTNQPIYEGAYESRLFISIKLLTAMSNWHAP